MTITSSNAIKTPPLEFVFKGKGIRVKVNPPERAMHNGVIKAPIELNMF